MRTPLMILLLLIATSAFSLKRRFTLECPDESKCCMCKSVYYFLSSCYCGTKRTEGSFLFGTYWGKYLTIQCDNSPNWGDFHLHNGSNSLRNFDDLSFDKCEFPQTVYLIDVVSQLGLHRVESLTFANGKMENKTLSKETFKGFSTVKKLLLINNGLKGIPVNLFTETRNLFLLSLRDNELTSLPVDILNYLSRLTSIDLSNNKISYLPEGLFVNNGRLVNLKLSGNSMTAITNQMLSKLVNLQELNFEFNNLTAIESKAFDNLKNLRIARFSYNRLTLNNTSVDSPFLHCPELDELCLGHNNISKIFDDWIFNRPILRVLNLTHNSIESIKTQDLLFISPRINVDLTHNKIKHIDFDDIEVWAQLFQYPVAPATYRQSRNVTVQMGDNPIFCDCNVYKFLRYLEGNMRPDVQELFRVVPVDLECHGPEGFVNVPVVQLSSKKVCAGGYAEKGKRQLVSFEDLKHLVE